MTHKLTEKQFKSFESEVEYWLEYFGILDWQVLVLFEKIDDARGDCTFNIPGKIATIRLSKEWNYPPKGFDVEKCAFHEVCELLLCQLTVFSNFFIKDSIVEEQTHYIIRTLENTIFKEKS